MTTTLELAADPQTQVNQILTEVGQIDTSIGAVDAVEIVLALQLALSHPSMLGPSFTRDRVEGFTRRLGTAIGKHPMLRSTFAAGFEAIEEARNKPPEQPKKKRKAVNRG